MFDKLLEDMLEASYQLKSDTDKSETKVQSPREISEQTVRSIKERGLKSVHDEVNSLLGEQVDKYSLIEPNNISKKDLPGILKSYIEKWTLSEMGALRLSGSQLSELERLYAFLRTSEGKKHLRSGIMEAMKIKPALLDEGDIPSLKKLRTNQSKEEVQEITKRIQKAAEFATQVNSTWTYLQLYMRGIQNILLRSYTHELSLAQNNAKRTEELISRLVNDDDEDSPLFTTLGSSFLAFERMTKDYTYKIKGIGDDLGLNKYRAVRMK